MRSNNSKALNYIIIITIKLIVKQIKSKNIFNMFVKYKIISNM